MKLSEWLDEYRNFDPNAVERPVTDMEDDWAEPDLLAPADRVRSTEPRWLKRAERVRYGRPTQI